MREGGVRNNCKIVCAKLYSTFISIRRCHGTVEISDFVVEVIRGYQENKTCSLELYLKKILYSDFSKIFF